jgi:hypothetical protein
MRKEMKRERGTRGKGMSVQGPMPLQFHEGTEVKKRREHIGIVCTSKREKNRK